MTEKEEMIEVELGGVPSIYDLMEQHWEEPEDQGEYAWVAQEEEEYEEGVAIRGVAIFHIDVLDFNADKAESDFLERFGALFSRLTDQGTAVMVLRNVKHGGDLGVRVEYFPLGY